MNESNLRFSAIDWSLDWDDFQKQIGQIISSCRDDDRSIPLPLPMVMEIGCAVLTAIDCTGCDARSCKARDNAILLPDEYENLKEKYGDRGFTSDRKLHLPCRFLSNNRCSIHKLDKPTICDTYPLQSGGTIEGSAALSLAIDCPAAVKYAKKLYLQVWKSRRISEKYEHHVSKQKPSAVDEAVNTFISKTARTSSPLSEHESGKSV